MFHYKERRDIWKGEGIYHVTFNVSQKENLLGELKAVPRERLRRYYADDEKWCAIPAVTDNDEVAMVDLSPFGQAVSEDLKKFQQRHEGMEVIKKMIMDNHIHFIVWVKKDVKQSILQALHGFQIGITQIAKRMGIWPRQGRRDEHNMFLPIDKNAPQPNTNCNNQPCTHTTTTNQHATTVPSQHGANAPTSSTTTTSQHATTVPSQHATNAPTSSCSSMAAQHATAVPSMKEGGTQRSLSSPFFVSNDRACDARPSAPDPLKTGDGHILEKPFLRTLSAKGQLQEMFDYISLNAYRKWVVKHNPHLFTLHKDTVVEGLHFRSLGNHWLLDWPERQMVECSRSETQADWDKRLEDILFYAKLGTVTYTAAVNKGEAYIARKVREAGCPLVILMKDGFPTAGSPHEKYFKPGGVYFDACKEARLLLMEAYPTTYEDKRLVTATENALRCKAQSRHQTYAPLPHNALRWRFMAGNELIRILVERPT